MWWILACLAAAVDSKYCVTDPNNATCVCADTTYVSISEPNLNSTLYDASTGVYLRFCGSPTAPIDIGNSNTLIYIASEAGQVAVELNLTARVPATVQFDNVIATVNSLDQTVLNVRYLSVTNSQVTPLNAASRFNVLSDSFSVDLPSLAYFGTIRTAQMTFSGVNMDTMVQNTTYHILPVSVDQTVRLNVPSVDVEIRFGKKNITLWKNDVFFAVQLDSQGQCVLGCAGGTYTLTCDDGVYPAEFMNPVLTCSYFAGPNPVFAINGSNWPVTSRHITVENFGFYGRVDVVLRGTGIPLSYTLHSNVYVLALEAENATIQGNLTIGSGGSIVNNLGLPTWFSFDALTRVTGAVGKLTWPEDVTLNITKYTDADYFARPVVSVLFHEMYGTNPTITRQVVLQNQFRAGTSITNNGTAIVSHPITGAFHSDAGNKQVTVSVELPRYGEVYNLRGIMDNYMDIYCNLFDFTCAELAVTFETPNTQATNLNAGEYTLTTACYHRNSDGYKCLAARLSALPTTAKQTICIADDIALSCSTQDHIAINPCDVPRLNKLLDAEVSTYVLNIYSPLLPTEAIDLQLFANKNLVIGGQNNPQIYLNVSDATVSRPTNLLVVDGCSLTLVGTQLDCPTVYLTNCIYSVTNENLTVTATNVTADFDAFSLLLFPNMQNVGILLGNGTFPILLSTASLTVNTTEVISATGYVTIYPNQATVLDFSWDGTGAVRQVDVNLKPINITGDYSITKMTNRAGLVTDVTFSGVWTNATFTVPLSFYWNNCHVRFASLPVPVNLYPENGTVECSNYGTTYTVANPVVLDQGTLTFVQGTAGTFNWSSVTAGQSVNVVADRAQVFEVSSLTLNENVTFTDTTQASITGHLYMYPGSVMSDASYSNTTVIHLENFDFRNPPYLNTITGTPSIVINHVLGTDDPQMLEHVQKDVRIACSYLPTFACESLRAATTFTSTYSDTASKINVSCSTADYGLNVCLQVTLVSPVTPVNTAPATNNNKAGLIAGLVVAFIVIIAIVVVVVFFVIRRRKRQLQENDNDAAKAAAALTGAALGQCPVPLRRARDQISSFHPPPIPLRQQDIEKLEAIALEAEMANDAKSSPKRSSTSPHIRLNSAQFDTSRRTTSVVFDDENDSRRTTPDDSDDSPKRRDTEPSSSPKRRDTAATEASSSRRDSPPKRRDTGATQASSSRRDSSPKRRDTGATDVSSSRRDSSPKRRNTAATEPSSSRPPATQARRPPTSRPQINFDDSYYSYSDYSDDPAPPPRRNQPSARRPPQRQPPQRQPPRRR